jgi:hypothetical protein
MSFSLNGGGHGPGRVKFLDEGLYVVSYKGIRRESFLPLRN